MMELTKGNLKLIAKNKPSIYSSLEQEMARQLLSSMEQEPVAYMQIDGDEIEYNGHNEFSGGGKGVPLYAAPQLPQPAVPECYQRLLHHAYGMTMGQDWNKGTMAGHHREKLCKAVEECRSAMLQGSEPEQGWIPCSERMPDETQPVIVVSDGGVVQRTVYQFCEGVWIDWYEQCDEVSADAFTHWMPLPAAPQHQELNK